MIYIEAEGNKEKQIQRVRKWSRVEERRARDLWRGGKGGEIPAKLKATQNWAV